MRNLISTLLLGGSLCFTGSAGYSETPGQALHKGECSACHLAYQANFLPIRSWQAIMADLSNHFGEDASLSDAARTEIEAYLVANAADRKGRNPRWLKSIPADVVPMRISELSWFTHEHGSRVQNWLKNNPSAGSISNCVACHKGAEKGYYED